MDHQEGLEVDHREAHHMEEALAGVDHMVAVLVEVVLMVVEIDNQ